MIRKLIVVIAMAVATCGQTPASKPTAAVRKPTIAVTSVVDNVINLVQGGMSEALVIKLLQREGKAYDLTTVDLLKLQKAGVSENIINVMMDPKANVVAQAGPPASPSDSPPSKDSSPGGASAVPAPPPPVSSAEVTPYPPDLPGVGEVTRKPRIIVDSFGYRSDKEQAQYWFNNNSVDVGAGVSDLLSSRLGNSPEITMLERTKLAALINEQNLGSSNRADLAVRAKIGKLAGAEYILVGDVVQFGWDSKAKTHKIPLVVIPKAHIPFSDIQWTTKEDKAVVAIGFRLIDVETGAQVTGLGGEGKGQSSRKGKDYSGTLAVPGAGWINGGGDMTSSAFCKTIIGEATSSAVDNIVAQLQASISHVPPKQRQIEGRVASVVPGTAYLAFGANEGVQRGDRYEIRQITDEIIDPGTKEKLDVQSVKVGELVVSDVRDKIASGNYGGQALSQDYCKGKGYLARLMSK